MRWQAIAHADPSNYRLAVTSTDRLPRSPPSRKTCAARRRVRSRRGSGARRMCHRLAKPTGQSGIRRAPRTLTRARRPRGIRRGPLVADATLRRPACTTRPTRSRPPGSAAGAAPPKREFGPLGTSRVWTSSSARGRRAPPGVMWICSPRAAMRISLFRKDERVNPPSAATGRPIDQTELLDEEAAQLLPVQRVIGVSFLLTGLHSRASRASRLSVTCLSHNPGAPCRNY